MVTRRKPPPPPPRRRRDPETARAEILDAAERLLVASPPGEVGLKDVAAATGVSHALVSHYFGTYAELVESVLVRRIRLLREVALAKLAQPGGLVDAEALVDVLFTALKDPLYVRLSLWALSTERTVGRDAFPFREQGMRILADALCARMLQDRPELAPGPLRERVEQALAIGNASAWGYALGREGWMGALAREPSAAFDAGIRRALAAMLRAHVLGE
jgi:AcrR family transcriptional regulator